MKHKCNCGNVAVWVYGPGCDDLNAFYCEDCVPRGCSCNSMHLEEIFPNGHPDAEEMRDDKGRELPCVEYDFDEDGWDEIRDD